MFILHNIVFYLYTLSLLWAETKDIETKKFSSFTWYAIANYTNQLFNLTYENHDYFQHGYITDIPFKLTTTANRWK